MEATPGWNDPPKGIGPPTGNLKINLNKRVAFPLSPEDASRATSSSPGPLLLPPKPTAAISDPEVSTNTELDEVDLDSKKEKVLETLTKGIEELSSSVQSSVSAKLKTLEDDWSQCDVEMKKLLVELTDYLDYKDSKGASTTQRKIVMKGGTKQWLIAVRQIVMHLETTQAEAEASNDDLMPLDLSKTSSY